MLTKTENEKYGEHGNPKRRGSWPRQFTSASRSIRVVIRACFVLFLTLGLRRGLADLHDQYVKREATDFTSLRHDDLILQHPGHYVRTLSGLHIGSRYEYIRHLGSGDEGSADLYQDVETETTVVIKTFTGFLRNKIPDAIRSDFSHYTDVWPTELEAGMTLRPVESASNFLLLSDYFILQQTDSEWAWATVSPFSEQGTLVSFAANIKQQGLSAEQLDLIFRPNFDEMLAALGTLHAADICHDDVKPDNIFVRSPTAWKLGDLGNMRHVNHAWHSTRSWTRQNQLRDCRDNDERRLIKSYLMFLRNACNDTDDFDDEFWAAETAWSCLYWDFTSSVGLTASKDGDKLPLESLEKRAERELLCTTIPWRLWKPQWFLTFWI